MFPGYRGGLHRRSLGVSGLGESDGKMCVGVFLRQKTAVFAVLLLVVFLIATQTVSTATTTYVSDDYPTIQGAMDAANPEDTVSYMTLAAFVSQCEVAGKHSSGSFATVDQKLYSVNVDGT